jgi:ABC-type sugar transport system substrate-binding protein
MKVLSRKSLVKGIALALVTLMSVTTLIGCGSTPSPAAATSTAAVVVSTASTQAPTVDPKASKLICYSQKSLDYFFWEACQESVKRPAEAAGFKFESAVANNDSAKQSSQFINFIAEKPAAIISDPIDSEGLIDAINKAAAAGIPVGIIDTPTTGGNVAITVAFDNHAAGVMAAEQIVADLKVKYGSEKGIVADFYGAMSSSAWRARKEGFEEVMKKYPNITLISVPGEGDMAKTHDAAINTFTKNPNIDAVHCPSDNPSLGLAEALKQSGRWFKVGEKGHIIFVTIDGEPVGADNLAGGFYDSIIVQDAAAYGQIAMELLQKYSMKGLAVPLGPYENSNYVWAKGEIVQSASGPSVVIPPYVMDQKNVNDPRNWSYITSKTWGMSYSVK